jgi:hypothetical protein
LADQEARKLADEHSRTWAEAERRAREQSRFEAERLTPQSSIAVTPLPKAKRARRQPLPWGKISAGLVVLIFISIAALPYIYHFDEYIPSIEQELSAQFNQPVHIGGLRASLLPLPKLDLQKVEIGSQQEVKIADVVLNFNLFNLFSQVKPIRKAELQDVVLNASKLDKEALWFQSIGVNKVYPVANLNVNNLKVMSNEVTLPPLSGEAQIDSLGKLVNVALKSDNGKFGIELHTGQSSRWQFTLNILENSLPALPDIVFNDLTAKGEVSEGGVTINDFDARIYTGILQGNAQLTWDKGWQLQGHAEAKTMELDQMLPNKVVSADIDGQGTFSFNAAKLSQLHDSPRLDGTFIAKKGHITGMDMVETARLMSHRHLVGGRTHFDEATGTLQFVNHSLHLSQLVISSNILNATGTLDISKGNQLSGSFLVDTKMHTGSVPQVLSGTITEMNLRAK